MSRADLNCCLPGEQEKSARALGQILTPQDTEACNSLFGPLSGTCSVRPGRAGVQPGNLTPRRTPGRTSDRASRFVVVGYETTQA